MKTEQAKTYTETEVNEMIAKAVRHDRELQAQVLRALPSFTPDIRQGWIENPKGLQKFLADLNPPESPKKETQPTTLTIPRTTPFDPEAFIGKGWKVVEEDERSLALTEVDLTKVRLVTCLKKGESSIKGEEKLKRLKEAGHIRLDAAVFKALWDNKHLIPEDWKKEINGYRTYIYFDATVLQGPSGYRYVLYLYWGGGGWRWFYDWLEDGWSSIGPSAVLVTPQSSST